MITCIYKISNLRNDKFYIGSAQNVKQRFSNHKWHLRKGDHINKKLQNSFNKYGETNFLFEIIEECKLEELLIREQHYIDTLKPFYNICQVAGNSLGTKKPIEEKLTAMKRMESKSKPVLQLDMNTQELIKEWPSIRRASQELGIDRMSIRRCCDLIRKHGGGFNWRYKTLI